MWADPWSTDAWGSGGEWPALRPERWTLSRRGSPPSGPDRGCWSAVRREEYGWPCTLWRITLLSSFSGGQEWGGTRGLRRHPCSDPGDTMAGMGGVKEEAGTAVTSR